MITEPETVTGILLIAHGSRRPEANSDLVRLAELVGEQGEYPLVEIAYLELAEPTIPEGARRCVERGATQVRMLPFFLSAGVHVRGDLERFREEFAAQYPSVVFTVCEPLGLHPKVVDVVLERLQADS